MAAESTQIDNRIGWAVAGHGRRRRAQLPTVLIVEQFLGLSASGSLQVFLHLRRNGGVPITIHGPSEHVLRDVQNVERGVKAARQCASVAQRRLGGWPEVSRDQHFLESNHDEPP